MKDLSKTRWSDRYDAIRAVFVSYKEIINSLQKLSEDDIEKKTQQTVKNLLNKIQSFAFYTLLLFFKEFIWIYQCFSHSFAEVRNGYFNYDRYC